tara:strand:- start:248 stop:733 length:486 start_codon:yes stop_codon:yes gene_type:complete
MTGQNEFSALPIEPQKPDSNTLSRVLIVDDISEMQSTLKRVFRRAGISTVHSASNIDEARSMLERAHEYSTPYDIVFVDQMMPGGSGLDLVEELIARGTEVVDRRKTGLFILSGLVEDGFRERVRACGALDLMEKPVSAEQLLTCCKRWAQFRAKGKPSAP